MEMTVEKIVDSFVNLIKAHALLLKLLKRCWNCPACMLHTYTVSKRFTSK